METGRSTFSGRRSREESSVQPSLDSNRTGFVNRREFVGHAPSFSGKVTSCTLSKLVHLSCTSGGARTSTMKNGGRMAERSRDVQDWTRARGRHAMLRLALKARKHKDLVTKTIRFWTHLPSLSRQLKSARSLTVIGYSPPDSQALACVAEIMLVR